MCLRSSRRRAITLVEVVASIGLVGVLLVSMLISASTHTRQINRSKKISQAVQLLDQQIAEWFASEEPFPY